jgi:hypothetical protein
VGELKSLGFKTDPEGAVVWVRALKTMEKTFGLKRRIMYE